MADDMEDPQPPEVNVQINVPPEQEAGTYANFLGVWHTPYEFTLDFAVTQPTKDPGTLPCRVVSRVKIPPKLAFQVLRALNENMTKYESTHGAIEQ